MFKKSIFSILCVLALVCCVWIGALAEEATETPTLPPLETPAPEMLEGLTFIIDGPDERMPMKVTYKDLVDGKLTLKGLTPGTYTVTEEDPETLLEDYVFDAESSTTVITIEVTAGGSVTATLLNVYEKGTPTPEPTPEPTEEPTPEPEEKVSIPVKKIWVDNDNADGNRPKSITVFLKADDQPVDSAVLNEANGWAYTFEGLDKTDADGKEIVYTISEVEVPMYTSTIEGYVITNTYAPETTEISVRKVWNDDENKAGIRPPSIYCYLNNGMTVVLNAANNWSATVSNLPTMLNGQPVSYFWTEQEVLGYEQEGKDIEGTVTTFTNGLRERPEPPADKPTPPTRGTPTITIDEYGTPLGVEVNINHVGDCFE